MEYIYIFRTTIGYPGGLWFFVLDRSFFFFLFLLVDDREDFFPGLLRH